MACNCSKNARPTGFGSGSNVGRTQQETQRAGAQVAPAQSASAPAANTEQSTQGATQSFALTVNGRTQTFGSRLEAQAANIRSGSKGTVRPA